MRYTLLTLLVCSLATSLPAQQPTREDKVRNDKTKVEADGFWIYNDLPKAIAEAKRTNKPILANLRCIPCEECVKLDDDLVNQDPAIRPLLEKFVCVRLVSTNGLDLSLFQFDYDQSFAVFLFNVDGTVYGRFGTRSHRTNWIGDVSVAGMAKALQGALDLHADYPNNAAVLKGKRGPKPEFPTPEQFPTLKSKYKATLDYAGKVVPSCIHCHQIGDAQKELVRAKGEPMPGRLLFPYPHPKSQGLILDPKEKATVSKVEADTSAEKAGFKVGDVIQTLDSQPLLSLADVQWVLHNTSGNGGRLPVKVLRKGEPMELMWRLERDWRTKDDISWRSSSWGLRRMATGGLLLEETESGLRVKHVGEYGAHAAAKNAGFQKGDVIALYDGKEFKRETDLLAHGVTERKPGDKVPVTVLRNGKKVELMLPMQQ